MITSTVRSEVSAARKWFTSKKSNFEFGPVAKFFTFFQGRCTTFAIIFTTMGAVLFALSVWGFIHGKDLTSLAAFTTSLALLVGAIFTGLVAHSVKEDWMSMKQQANVNVTVDAGTKPPTPS